MAESIDIYDANLAHLGVMERRKAHLEGQWHRTFHCWIVSAAEGGRMLLQKRADTMRNFPGLLDVSAAGHLEAGESVMEGIREVVEELGIDVDPSAMRELGERVEVADQENGQRNREYQSVFLCREDATLDGYKPQVDEVAALVWLPINDGFDLFSGSVNSLDLDGYSYETTEGASWAPFVMTVTRDSFLPRIQRYYTTALIMAERLLEGREPLAIS